MRRTSCLAVLVVCAPLLLGVAGATLAGGCGASPAITVLQLEPGHPGDPVTGDAVKMKRGGQEVFAGLHGGFYVVRSAEDWRNAWSGGDQPPFPSALDPSRSMLLLVVAEHEETTRLRIDKVVETGSMVAVWASDTRAGEGCVTSEDRAPFDGVVVPRIDKPVKFFVSKERAASCGEGPAVTMKCRVNDDATWVAKTSAQPGDKIDCEMTAASHGTFAITDSLLTLSQLPAGSTAKLAYTKAPTRGGFVVDVFGTYGLLAETTDEGGRKSSGAATIEALPPHTRDVLVQLVWTNFDASDDPETFPRVTLRAFEEGHLGVSSKECSVDAPRTDLCHVKAQGAYTHMVLKASKKRVPLEVFYADERIEKGPLVCVQVYFEGARIAETCDHRHRDPQERWNVGTVEMESGRIAGLPSLAAIADAGPDGGHADGGHADGGHADGGSPDAGAAQKDPAKK